MHYYPFGDAYVNLVLSASNDHLEFVYALSQLFSDKCSMDVTLFDVPQSYIKEDNKMLTYYSQSKEIENAVDQLFDLILYRNNTVKEAVEKCELVEEFDQKVIMVNSLTALKRILSDKANEKLGLILEKGEAKYNITIVIAETVKNISSISFDKWYKKNITQRDGIWVGNGVSEQYQLKGTKTTGEMHEDITLEFGFVFEKGNSTKVKMINDGGGSIDGKSSC